MRRAFQGDKREEGNHAPFLTECTINAIFVVGLMILGSWLEGINGKHGIVDEFLTPLPLGLAGLFTVFLEWLVA